jgi:type VI secretion system protein ImpC
MAEPNQQASAAAPAAALDTFQSLLEKRIPVAGKPEARTQVQQAVQTLAEQALRDTVVVSDDAIATIKAMIAEIDAKLTSQINAILHQPRFQEVESAWRGLHHLVNNTETDPLLQVRVMNISKKDLGRSLRSFKGAQWDRSPLFNMIYEQEYGTPGGAAYGCLVGDYYFDHSAPDVEILDQMSMIAAAAHAPFISSAAPSLLRMESWQDLGKPSGIAQIFRNPSYAGWNSLRQSENAKYLGLTMPRFLARIPYGAKTDPVEDFAFEEETGTGDHRSYVWANSAYAMAVNINRSFKEFGWCSRIRGLESGGAVEGLPVHTFPSDDGGVDMKCPTEISITDRRAKELEDCGLMPLLHKKNTDIAYFQAAQSLQKPTEYDDATATGNAKLGARLPYLFASCRFAHYLKVMVREKIGGFASADDMQRYLSEWIQKFVLTNPSIVGEEERARKPLAEAAVMVEENEADPGFYTAQFFLRPHFQLEGMDIKLSLVSRMPAAA